MKKNIAKIVAALVVIAFAAVGTFFALSRGSKNVDKISIITSNFPAFDFARAVAGDKAEIKMLVKPGTETHDFEPTPQDIIDVKSSDLFIYTGGESDAWIEDILGDLEGSNTKLFRMMDAVTVVEEELVEGMEHEEEHEPDDHEPEYDEHVWTSLKNAAKIITGLKDELNKISPENEALFETNAENYLARLAAIDQGFRSVVANGARTTLVFGDRFPLRYFVDDYDLDYFAAFPGCSEQTEASSKTIAFLIDKIKSEGIPVVFKIEMSSGEIASTIAAETNAKVLIFHSAHNISADDFKAGVTYAEIMKRNVEALKEALE